MKPQDVFDQIVADYDTSYEDNFNCYSFHDATLKIPVGEFPVGYQFSNIEFDLTKGKIIISNDESDTLFEGALKLTVEPITTEQEEPVQQ